MLAVARRNQRLGVVAVTSNDQIRELIAQRAKLAIDVAELDDGASLYENGMTSHATVDLMLAIEDALDIEFPEEMLRREVFESIASIARAVARLDVGGS